MPSADLLLYFQKDLALEKQWWVNGNHYAKSLEAWLERMSERRQREAMWPHLEATYGKDEALRWFYRWQVFYMACAELFAFNGGEEWGVCHYLFEKVR